MAKILKKRPLNISSQSIGMYQSVFNELKERMALFTKEKEINPLFAEVSEKTFVFHMSANRHGADELFCKFIIEQGYKVSANTLFKELIMISIWDDEPT